VIDFRYHLVSIVSIFLALAVGIVLGAGPLQSGIGSTLGEQVAALRAEKEDLRKSLDASQKLVVAEQEYAAAVTPRVVAGQLTGRTVALVVMPSTERDIVATTRDALEASGATVTDALTVTEDWFDPTLASERAKAAQGAATALGLESYATGDGLLREVFAKLTVSKQPATASASRTAALGILADADLVDGSVAELAPAQLAVVVSGDFSGSEQAVRDRAIAVRRLVQSLEAGSDTTVVAGGVPVKAAGQPASSDAIAAVRQDSDASEKISTIDHAREGMGPAVVVLALVAQLADQVGHYGISEGATAVMPSLAPVGP
jgi:hypothetical protein